MRNDAEKKRKTYNVKSLAKWRRHQVRKDARKCQSCRTLHRFGIHKRKMGKKDLAKTTPKIGENKKTRGQ